MNCSQTTINTLYHHWSYTEHFMFPAISYEIFFFLVINILDQWSRNNLYCIEISYEISFMSKKLSMCIILNIWMNHDKKNQFSDTFSFCIARPIRMCIKCNQIIRGLGRIVFIVFRITTRTYTKIQTWWNKPAILVHCSYVKV